MLAIDQIITILSLKIQYARYGCLNVFNQSESLKSAQHNFTSKIFMIGSSPDSKFGPPMSVAIIRPTESRIFMCSKNSPRRRSSIQILQLIIRCRSTINIIGKGWSSQSNQFRESEFGRQTSATEKKNFNGKIMSGVSKQTFARGRTGALDQWYWEETHNWVVVSLSPRAGY